MEIKQHTPVHQRKKKNHKGNLRYLETNDLCDAPKATLRRQFIAIKAQVKKEKDFKSTT